MTLALQILAAVSLVVLMAYLVPLLIQLRKTAAAVEHLSRQAEHDLAAALAEIQGVRARVDEVAELAKRGLDQGSPMSHMVSGILRAIPALLGRAPSAPNFFETLLTGLASALHWFRRAKPARPQEEQP